MTLIGTCSFMRNKTAGSDETAVMRHVSRSSGSKCPSFGMLSTSRHSPGVLTTRHRSPSARSTRRRSPNARSTKHLSPGTLSPERFLPSALSTRCRSTGPQSNGHCSPDTLTQRRPTMPDTLFGTTHTNQHSYGLHQAKPQLLAPSSEADHRANTATATSSASCRATSCGPEAAQASCGPGVYASYGPAAKSSCGSAAQVSSGAVAYASCVLHSTSALLRLEEDVEESPEEEAAYFAPQPPPGPVRLLLVRSAPRPLSSYQAASLEEEGGEIAEAVGSAQLADVALCSGSGEWESASQCWSVPHRSACRSVATQAQPDWKAQTNCEARSYRPIYHDVAGGEGAGSGEGCGAAPAGRSRRGPWAGGVRALRDSHVRLVVRQLRLIARLNRALDRAASPASVAR